MVLHETCSGGKTIAICSYLRPDALPVTPLIRVSPSKFQLFRDCKLRACLESNRFPELLPRSPSARCGTVIHRIIEAAAKRKINEEDDFEEYWNRYIMIEEKEMEDSWIERHLVPLRKSTPKYELKKYQCLLTTRSMFNKTGSHVAHDPINRISREIWLETQDKIVGGFVDAIISTNIGDTIIDYKTGNINRQDGNHGSVQEIYKVQLQLYAAIYNSAFGTWPVSLQIVGIDETSYEIDFDQEDSVNLLNEAYHMITKINFIISNEKNLSEMNDLLSSPSPDTCRYCLYRPACQSYVKRKETTPSAEWPKDIIGTLYEKKILGNGLMLIRIAADNNNSDIITIRGLHPGRHPALNFESDKMAIFSMISDNSPNSFKEGILTTIYIVS